MVALLDGSKYKGKHYKPGATTIEPLNMLINALQKYSNNKANALPSKDVDHELLKTVI